jgi:integrase
MATNYLFPHGRGFKYLRAVPRDLRSEISRRTWVKTFPGSVSFDDAKAKCRELAVEHDRLVAGLRKAPQATRDAIVAAGGWDAFARLPDRREQGLPFVEAVARLEDDPGSVTTPEDAAEIIDARRIAREMRAEIKQARQAIAKIARPVTGDGIAVLIPMWIAINRPKSPKVVQKMRLYVSRFVDVVGPKAPSQVTREDAIAFRDAAESTYPRPTAMKMLENVNALFNVALKKGDLPANPLHGLKLLGKEDDDKEDKEGFSSEQALLIFKRMKADLPVHFQWVIRLCAYHGMRSGEASQLRPEDITVSHGIPVMLIRARKDKETSVKNKSSRREVPIHPDCMEIVTLAAKTKGEWLFDFPARRGHNRGAYFQKEANLWLRRIGITDPVYTMHSWRHRWRTLMREIECPDYVTLGIGGWSLGRGEHAKYGTVSLAKRAEWIKKVDPLA